MHAIADALSLLATALDPRAWDEQVLSLAADAAHAQLQHLVPRARERRLSGGDVLGAFRAHRESVLAAQGACVIRTRAHGGAVANSYRGKADADWLELVTVVSERDGALAVDGTSVAVYRTWARSAPYGKAEELTSKAMRAALPTAREWARSASLDAPATVAA